MSEDVTELRVRLAQFEEALTLMTAARDYEKAAHARTRNYYENTSARARIVRDRQMLIDALNTIAAHKTWNECADATPQIRQTKADISNILDEAIEQARAAIAKAQS